MRLFPFLILGYLAVGLQSGLAGHWDVGGSRPNLPLILAVFVAAAASPPAALLGAFTLGLLQDVATLDALGLHAFAYGVMAVVIVSLRQSLDERQYPIQMMLVGVGSVLVAGVLLIVDRLLVDHAMPEARLGLGQLAGNVAYTLLLASVVLVILNKARRWMGLGGSGGYRR
ncbi:MAG: rod shape-determining protein MreD [Phycisphaerae bacterium]